jgi:hypothetical protein
MMLITVGIAIYSLIVYLYNFNKDIKHYKPLWKFLSVKFAIFLSVWQRIILNVIKIEKLLPLVTKHNGIVVPLNSGEYIDNLLVCIEMFVLSLIIVRCYSYEDFEQGISVGENANKSSILAIPKIL